MIALDTSSLIAYFAGEKGADVEAVDLSLAEKQAVFPPVVLTELLSDPILPLEIRGEIMQIPVLSLEEGYWEKTGLLRAKVIKKGLKAKLADALIAQNCIDHKVCLITRDHDFRHFEPLGLHVNILDG